MLGPIPTIRELGITASIGVGYKIITNPIMLPLTASYFRFSRDYARCISKASRPSAAKSSSVSASSPTSTTPAWCLPSPPVLLKGIAVWQSHGRHIGALRPGAPEPRPDARYNQDIENIVKRFDLGMDVLTVVFETPNDSCSNFEVLNYIEQFTPHMSQLPGVLSVQSLSALAKFANAGLNEGNPKMIALPRDSKAPQVAVGYLPEAGGLFNRACTMMAANVYLADHKATTIEPAIHAVKSFREQFDGKPLGIEVRLASGNVGVLAATNEEVEAANCR
ncbi:MAG: hypothetical protein MZW92_08300 [Comamonadaceae bacterium]|nr:hypothetical protein [Comamonadaceae bacterium]